MNAWNFVAGVVAGGAVSIISMVVGAAIATTAQTGKKHDQAEREYFENKNKENS